MWHHAKRKAITMPTLDEIDDLLANPSAALQKRKRKKQATALAELPPEEEDSLLANLGQGAMSGLSLVGHVLDKHTGSRALRGLLAGKPRELASMLPFSDTLGITRPEDITSGNELLGNPKDTSLFTPEGAAGFAVEAVLDPTLPFTGFLKGGLTAGGKLLKTAGGLEKVTRGVSKAAQAGGKFVGPRVAKMGTTLGKVLADPAAHGIDDVAELTDKLIKANKGKAIAQHVLDAPLGGNLSYGLPFMEPLGVIGKKGGVGEKVAHAMDVVGDKLRYGNIPGTAYSPGRHLAQLFNPTTKGLASKEFQQAAEVVYDAEPGLKAGVTQPIFRGVEDALKDPGFDQRAFMREAEGIDPPGKYQDLIKAIKEPQNKSFAKRQEMGATGKALSDDFAQYFPRTADLANDLEDADTLPALKELSTDHGARLARSNALRNMTRGGDTINDLLQDPAILGAKDSAEVSRRLQTHHAFELPSHQEADFNELAKMIEGYKKNTGATTAAYTGDPLPNFWKNPLLSAMEKGKGGVRAEGHARIITEGLQAGLKTPLAPHELATAKPLGKVLEMGGLIHGDEVKGPVKEIAKLMGFPEFDRAAEMAKAGTPPPFNMQGLNNVRALVRQGVLTKADLRPHLQAYKAWKAQDKAAKEAVEQAYQGWKSKVTSLPVPKRIYDDVNRATALFTQPKEVEGLTKAVDSALALFKSGVLAWPAFHSRNLFGAKVTDYTMGEFSLWSNKMANDFVTGKQIDALKFPFVQQALAKNGMSPTQENANQILRTTLASYGIISPGNGTMSQIGSGVKRGATTLEELDRQIPGKSPMGLRPALKEWKKGTANPLDIKGVMDRQGKVRETTGFAPLKVNEAFGNYVDALTRLPPLLNQLARGVDFEESLGRVLAAQVDYSRRAFTPFENSIVKRWLPFYSFTRKQAAHVFDQLTHAPSGRLAQIVRGQGRTRDDEQFVPSHIAQTTAMPIPGAPEGSQRFLTSLGLMHEDPLNIIRPGQTAFKTVSGTLEDLVGRINPIAKAPLELATGRQFYTGRDLQDLEGNLGRIGANLTGRKEAYDTPILLEQAISNSPLSRVATTLRTLTDTRKGVGAKASNLLSGVRVQDVDQEKGKNIAMREGLEDLLRGKSGIRQLRPHLYSKEEDLQNLSENDKLALALYKRLATEATKKARKAKPKKPKKETAK